MKYFILILFIILTTITPTIAETKEGVKDCYDYYLTEGPNQRLVVNSNIQLLLDKSTNPVLNADIIRFGSDAGQALYQRVFKIGPVTAIVMSAYQMSVELKQYPNNLWPITEPLILKEINEWCVGSKIEKKK